MAKASGPVLVEWDVLALEEFYRNPDGPLGYELIGRLGEVVLEGAKARALRRTGNMIDAMYTELGDDLEGLYADIVSPVQDPSTGFPYAIVHEARRVRDRRPHRSLIPSLVDILKVVS